MQRIGLGSFRTWSTPRPTTSSTSHRRSRPGGQHILRATSETKACVTSEAFRKDWCEIAELVAAPCSYLFEHERRRAELLHVAEELGQLKSAEFASVRPC